jgi:MFS transporter, DHA1 family, staphyloferrin A biosynthesis exporter
LTDEVSTPASTSALSSSAFRTYLCGIIAANIGFRIQSVALAILVYRTTGSALDLGIVSAIGTVPAVLCTIFGGILADRCDTRLVWAINSGISATLVGLLGWLTLNNAIPIGQIYALAALMGIVAGVNMPLSQSYFPSLIPPSALKSGVTFNSMSMSIASIFGPTLAGLIIAAVDLSAAFAVAALCWSLPVLIAPVLPARKVNPHKSSRTLADFRLGFNFIGQHRLVLVLAALIVTNYLLIYGWVQTLPAFVALFAGGEREVGYASTAAGAGATLGILLTGRLRPGIYLGYQILAATTFFATMVIVLAFVPSFYLVPILAFLAHAGNGLFSNCCSIAIQARIPEPVRGRVMGALSVLFNFSSFSGMWTGSAIALVGDVRWGMAVGPFAMLGIVLLVLATQRKIRTLAEI